MKVLKYVMIIFVLISIVGFSESADSVEERGEGSTRYFVFDNFEQVREVISEQGLTFEKETRSPLIVDYDEGSTNWGVNSTRSEKYRGEVVRNVLPDGSNNMGYQGVYVGIEYINEEATDLVSYDDLEITQSIALSKWLINEDLRLETFEKVKNYAETDPSRQLTEAIHTDRVLHYIQGPTTKGETQVNMPYFATHKELYGQFIINIVLDGIWLDHEEVSIVLNQLVITAKIEADLGMKRVKYYEKMFSEADEEDEEIPEVYKITGILKYMRRDDSFLEMMNGKISKKRLDFMNNQMTKLCKNQMIFLSIQDQDYNELANFGPVLTDDNGQFEFNYPYAIDKGHSIVIVTPLIYLKSNDTNSQSYAIMDQKHCSRTNNYVYIELVDKDVYYEDDLILDDLYLIDVDSSVFRNGAELRQDFVNGFIYSMSYNMIQLVENFYTETIGYELPSGKESLLEVYHSTNDVIRDNYAGNYDHVVNRINIADYFSTWSGFSFMNSIIYHEFSHKVMFDMYGGKYPQASSSDWLIGTYGNDSTAHSLTEGFAYFMQHVISEYYGGTGNNFPSPIYGNIEPDYPAWLNSGLHEARAIAGLLYDLYDDGSQNQSEGEYRDDDTVSIPIKSLLEMILSEPLDNFAQLYEKLIATYPNKKESIDSIVIAHGFFSVNEIQLEGAGEYHQGEGFVDDNRNYKYDKGESVINYNAVDEDGNRYQSYEEGSKIGYASYPENKKRQMQIYDPNYRIKTDSSFLSYKMEVLFSENSYLNYSGTVTAFDGYINLVVLPYNHNATIKVYPIGYESKVEPFTITTDYLSENYDEIREQGYIDDWFIEIDKSTQQLSDILNVMPIMVSQVILEEENIDNLSIDRPLLSNQKSGLFDALAEYSFTEDFPESILVVDEVQEEPIEDNEEVQKKDLSDTSADEVLEVENEKDEEIEVINIQDIIFPVLFIIVIILVVIVRRKRNR